MSAYPSTHFTCCHDSFCYPLSKGKIHKNRGQKNVIPKGRQELGRTTLRLPVIENHRKYHSSKRKPEQDPHFSLTTYSVTFKIIFLSNVLKKIGLFLFFFKLSILLYMQTGPLLMGNNQTCYLWFLVKFTHSEIQPRTKMLLTELAVDRIHRQLKLHTDFSGKIQCPYPSLV